MNTRGHCPLCGSMLGVERIYWDSAMRAVIGNGHVRTLTPQQARLFETLWPPRGEYRKAADIATQLYPTYYVSPHGGVPRVSSMVKRLRPILAPLKIEIEGCRARDRGGFRIVIPASRSAPIAKRARVDRSAHMGFAG